MIHQTFPTGFHKTVQIYVLGKKELSNENSSEYFLDFVSNFLNKPKEQIFILDQVHGERIIRTEEYSNNLQGDALVSFEENKVLIIKTADCMPILIWSKKVPFIAAIHSGWKGSLLGITEKLLGLCAKHNVPFSSLEMFIGPRATGEDYEIGKDVESLFLEKKPKGEYLIYKNNKIYLDLKTFLVEQIINSFGFLRIHSFNHSTINSNSEYFSHRKGETGRNLSLIYLT